MYINVEITRLLSQDARYTPQLSLLSEYIMAHYGPIMAPLLWPHYGHKENVSFIKTEWLHLLNLACLSTLFAGINVYVFGKVPPPPPPTRVICCRCSVMYGSTMIYYNKFGPCNISTMATEGYILYVCLPKHIWNHINRMHQSIGIYN